MIVENQRSHAVEVARLHERMDGMEERERRRDEREQKRENRRDTALERIEGKIDAALSSHGTIDN